MKKIIYILFLFLIPILCYLIYHLTLNTKPNLTLIGDYPNDISKVEKSILVKTYNNDFTSKDYHLTDLLNIIKYNQELVIEEKTVSIHQVLKKTDILIVSIGINDLYSKLNSPNKEIYTYLNKMVNNYQLLLSEIAKYDYQKVIILGYYNTTNKNNDLFTYINYKLEKLAKTYNYTYLNLQKELGNHEKYYQNNNTFYLKEAGVSKINTLIVEKLKKY